MKVMKEETGGNIYENLAGKMHEGNRAAIGRRIRMARKSKHMTQEELGRRLNTNGKYISKVENGKSTPSLHRLVQIAKALDRPCDYFIRDMNVDEYFLGGNGTGNYERSVIRMVYDFLNDISIIMASAEETERERKCRW